MRRAAALALLALAGCHDEDEITIVNAGAEPVLVDLSWDEGDDYYWYDDGHHHRFVELPPGGVYHDDVGYVDELDVVVFRKSDGLILFADDFDAEDFDDDHGHVEITVVP